jgi:hypothetical protein
VSSRLVVVALLAGCVRGNPPLGADAAPDATVLPPGCDYVELADPTNDLTITNGVPEQTGLTFTQSTTICGKLDRGHFDATAMDLDSDSYTLAIAARSQLLVSFAGAGTEVLASIDVQVLDATLAVVDHGAFLGSHAGFSTTLDPGTYTFAVFAKNATDLAASLDYKLRIVADVPETRCARVTGAAAYTEAADGALSDGNDMVEVRYLDAPHRALTAATSDAPEPSGIVTSAGTNVRIAGTSAAVNAPDEFHDRDTYLVTTGAHDQLAVRVDWAGTAADLDFLVFPENNSEEIASGTAVAKQAPEQATFPVLPNTRYWLWVGAYDTSSNAAVPYDVTLCPTQFAQ